MKGNRLIWGE